MIFRVYDYVVCQKIVGFLAPSFLMYSISFVLSVLRSLDDLKEVEKNNDLNMIFRNQLIAMQRGTLGMLF